MNDSMELTKAWLAAHRMALVALAKVVATTKSEQNTFIGILRDHEANYAASSIEEDPSIAAELGNIRLLVEREFR